MMIQVKVFNRKTSDQNLEDCNKFLKSISKKDFVTHKTHMNNGNMIHVVTYSK